MPANSVETARELNIQLTKEIEKIGHALGFRPQREYPIPGGRIDVVWTTEIPPMFEYRNLPIVGFEIESSWRTRKHIKGDLLNLQDLGASLGIIVIAGATKKDHELRDFAAKMVLRPGHRILIWDANDVWRASTGERLEEHDVFPLVRTRPVAQESGELPAVGKYWALAEHLRSSTLSRLSLSFSQVEHIIKMALPPSCRKHPQHWRSVHGSAVARAIASAGWYATSVDIDGQQVVFEQRSD